MPIVIAADVATAWKEAVGHCLAAQGREVPSLVVQLEISGPSDDVAFRDSVDRVLLREGRGTTGTVSRTIFPDGLWNPTKPRADLFERYLRILPKLRKCPLNRRGLYFERMIAYPTDAKKLTTKNQLEFIISTFSRGNHRRTALQASLYNPHIDASNSRRLGFPCLQQVSLMPSRSGDLTLVGYYPVHYIFERAYGNYLGLVHLGRFMAQEMHLSLTRVVCIAGVATFEVTPSKISALRIA